MTYAGLDYAILEELRRDGRASLRTVAERLDVSTSTVSHRVKHMESEGIIRGYKPILDYSKLGYRLTAITKIKAKGTRIPEIVEELVKEETLVDVYEITGDYDVLVIGKYSDEAMMNLEIKRMLSHPEIESTNTSIVLSIAKEDGDPALRSAAESGG
jgi:DNA-binding Lrp family transcriptional regulator